MLLRKIDSFIQRGTFIEHYTHDRIMVDVQVGEHHNMWIGADAGPKYKPFRRKRTDFSSPKFKVENDHADNV